jgi:uncharacterized membrane protein YqaE (UPF0057 family)
MENSKQSTNDMVSTESKTNPSLLFSMVTVNLLWLPMYSILMTSIECVSSECTSHSFIGLTDSHNGFLDGFLSVMLNTAAYMVFLPPIGLMIIAGCCGVGFILNFLSIGIKCEFPHAQNNRFTWSLICGGIACVTTATSLSLIPAMIGVSQGLDVKTKRMIISLILTSFLIGFFLPSLHLIQSKIIKNNANA